jgi:hypothetical protein
VNNALLTLCKQCMVTRRRHSTTHRSLTVSRAAAMLEMPYGNFLCMRCTTERSGRGNWHGGHARPWCRAPDDSTSAEALPHGVGVGLLQLGQLGSSLAVVLHCITVTVLSAD